MKIRRLSWIAVAVAGVLAMVVVPLLPQLGASAGNYDDLPTAYYVEDLGGAKLYVGQLFNWNDWVGSNVAITLVGAYADVLSSATFSCVDYEYDPYGETAGWRALSTSASYSDTPLWTYHNWPDDPIYNGVMYSTGDVRSMVGWGSSSSYCGYVQQAYMAATYGFIEYQSNTAAYHSQSYTNTTYP